MTQYHIIQTDNPLPYRDQILQSWDENLPGTPHKRLEWMSEGNPAGPSIWILAFPENSETLAGSISIMPRRFYAKGREMKAGILGDLMIQTKHRVFGPVMKLIRTAVELKRTLGLDFIYTIPNKQSLEVLKRAGFQKIKDLICYSKPIQIQPYLKKYIPTWEAAIFAPLAEFLLRGISRETYLSSSGTFQEIREFDESFDVLWEKLRMQSGGLMGDRCSAQLNWRYRQNPLCSFRAVTYRKNREGGFLGYGMFCIEDKRMELYDLVAIEEGAYGGLLKRISSLAREEEVQTIFCTIPSTSRWLRELKSFGFFDARGDIQVFSYGDSRGRLADWEYFSGDRNI